ncbi:ATP-dependent helicase [Amycolatopsis magusensis]|uniref:DNA 3'-5' helicase n=1 Tax=Amycolatopsis magusensis TaxID=882444 RepID=A0ABS4PPN6_9PSEU|nr:ATP-dependent DNA helicase [Amycolatopsis magusensis]MBP2180860.1 DNA helicase-2/ATP-dependent DNA helicase PcrA [Amycolatopsis magusensis]
MTVTLPGGRPPDPRRGTADRLVTPADVAEALGLHPPTPEQAAVIAAPTEPALVVAGAGAGKTETMAARVVWLVANGFVTPEQVLGLTFTRKAARQLGERVRARLRRLAGSGLLDRVDPSGGRRASVMAGEPTVLTYHAYAGRLLAEHGLRLPVRPGARLLSETASWQLAHRVVSHWDPDLDTDKVPPTITAHVLGLAGELGEHLVSTDRLAEYTAWLSALIENAPKAKGQRDSLPVKLQEIVAAQRFRLALLPLVEAYHERKRAEGALDFADQMSLAAGLVTDHEEVVIGERERYTAVLLDEYQDTGHAQRVLLRGLFGMGEHPSMTVTAVGDPAQAIYGWRGASAANLPRFTTDFPKSTDEGLAPADEYGLLTSFRNPPEVLVLANAIVEPLRAKGLGVKQLRARVGAHPADVSVALLPDIRVEREWVAERLAERWFTAIEATGEPPTAAVLVRRRADMAPIAAELRARGMPVEVVGLGGLLEEPEVADLVSTLRVLADPLAGTAAARLLTGARWRLGAADVKALWSRAVELSADPAAPKETEATLVPERAEHTGLVDAIDDPGEADRYSREGYRRIQRLGAELATLRRRLDQSLPELVSDVERTMLLDVEALARPNAAGRAHLDAFADVVTEFAETSPTATLMSFLDYLATAEHAEDGLSPGEVEVVPDRVQVLTVHAAKGLEWQYVAVPHLVNDVFPSKRRSSSWLRTVTALPAKFRGDEQDLPKLRLSGGENRKEVLEELELHEANFADREADEERRLCYVALTRSEHGLLVSGHWWNESSAKPKGPSTFLSEVREVVIEEGAGDLGVIEQWADPPENEEENPLTTATRTAVWPVDPLGSRRSAVTEGVELVLDELAVLSRRDPEEPDPDEGHEDPDGWIADTDVLLAERAKAVGRTEDIVLPDHLSVSQLVELAADPESLAGKLRRPLPAPPNSFARRGTAFHAWLEQRFSGDRLLDFEDLPGAADDEAVGDGELELLQRAFEHSEWASRTPHDVEVPFSAEVDGINLRGRMDAVFADPDGGWTVLDWKTGGVPGPDRLPALSVQLAAYRLAWSVLAGVPLEKVRAAFHYVRDDRTISPVDLLDFDGLREILRSVPEE